MSATSNAFDKTIGLEVSLGSVGSRRKAKKALVSIQSQIPETADPDKDSLYLGKELFDCKEFRAIQQVHRKIRSFVDAHALPSMLKRGVYILPVSNLEKVNTGLKKLEGLLKEAVDRFIEIYPEEVKRSKDRLGPLWDGSDYVQDPEVLRSAFYMKVSYPELGVSTNLEKVDPTIFAEERARLQKAFEEASELIRASLRAGMLDLVQHLVERLTPDATGRQKIIKPASVVNLLEFIQSFDPKNVTDDAELAALVSKCKSILGGVDPETFSFDSLLVSDLGSKLSPVKEALEGMVQVGPSRKILV